MAELQPQLFVFGAREVCKTSPVSEKMHSTSHVPSQSSPVTRMISHHDIPVPTDDEDLQHEPNAMDIPVPDDDEDDLTSQQWQKQIAPTCKCGKPCRQLTVHKRGPNLGRVFFRCGEPQGAQCTFFQWEDGDVDTGNATQQLVLSKTCLCGQPPVRLCVRKDGPNRGRIFFKCAKVRGEQCSFFCWEHDGAQNLVPTCQPALPRNAIDGADDCAVCMGPMADVGKATLCCGHTFCLECTVKVLCGTGHAHGSNACPLCRADVVSQQLFDELQHDDDSDPSYDSSGYDDSDDEDDDDDDEAWRHSVDSEDDESDDESY